MNRISIDASLPPLRLPGTVLNELYAHARETYPEECCGLLTGDEQEPFRGVHRCRNDMTRLHRQDPVGHPRDGRHAFHMNESDYMRVMRDAEEQAERVYGVYHSHVGVGAYFSELDQEYALQELFPFPEATHIVLSVIERHVKEVSAFRRIASGRCFEGRRVEVTGA